jgi:hypothetical protein
MGLSKDFMTLILKNDFMILIEEKYRSLVADKPEEYDLIVLRKPSQHPTWCVRKRHVYVFSTATKV